MILVGLPLMILGFFFLLVSGIGALRLPDFYTRSHAIGVTDTLGTLLVLGGLVLANGLTLVSAKLFFIVVFVYIANPTLTHVYVRAALKAGLKPWTKNTSND